MNDINDKSALNQQYGKVAVLMGGNSAERAISLKTGEAVHAALRRKGVDAYTVDANKHVVQQLIEGKFDRVFIALHGRGGEDGTIQGALQTLGIPYTGSDVSGSALAMDKIRCKRIWLQQGLPTPDFTEASSEKEVSDALRTIGSPLMIKPAHEGSSCGISKVGSEDEVSKAWLTACQYHDNILAEQYIEGTEYTAAILEQTVLPLIRLETPHAFYDYKAKYEVDSTQYICPCGLSEEQENKVKDLALKAFNAVGASGWGRVDMFIDKHDQAWLIEVNTVPGMTDHSLVPMAAKQQGIGFDDLVIEILDSSFSWEKKEERLTA